MGVGRSGLRNYLDDNLVKFPSLLSSVFHSNRFCLDNCAKTTRGLKYSSPIEKACVKPANIYLSENFYSFVFVINVHDATSP